MKLILHPGFFVVTSFAFGLSLLITLEILNVSYEYGPAIRNIPQNLLRPLIQKLAGIAPYA